ncbi:MAG TPA: hypothetical protein ENH59_04655 [Bacteroidetes bacterium]|jgi:hypothetical protein|nr:hypothetical protein [Bacteroidota bacterium]
MKRIVLYIIILLISFLIVAEIIARKYDQYCIRKINESLTSFIYEYLILDFYKENLRMPNDIQESKESPWIHHISEEQLIDPYSRNNDRIRFIPIYNKDLCYFTSGIVISSGIDGYFDNYCTKNDSITINQFKNRNNPYNTTYSINTKYKEIEWKGIRIFNYVFGNKDLIIQYFDIVRHIKFSSHFTNNIYSLNELIERIYAYNITNLGEELYITNQYFSVELDIDSLDCNLLNDKTLIVNWGDNILEFNFLIPTFKEPNISGHLEIACFFKSFQKESKKMIFNQAIITYNDLNN